MLFKIDRSMEVGSLIEFTISMPAAIIGASKDVLVNCTGRVVRCSPESDDRCAVAAVIDEYKFER